MTGVGSSVPLRIAHTRPTCSATNRAVSPGRAVMAVGAGTSAIFVRVKRARCGSGAAVVAVAPAAVVVVLDARDGRVVARDPSELHAAATSAVTTIAGPSSRDRKS